MIVVQRHRRAGLRFVVTLLALAGCGRLGFDSTELDRDGGADAGDADGKPVDLVEHVPCGERVPLIQTGLADAMFWISDDAGDWLVVTHHEGATAHPYVRYRLNATATAIEATAAGLVVDSVDSVGALVRTTTGTALIISELMSSGTSVHALKDGAVVTTTQVTGALGFSYMPSARADNGSLAIVGTSGGSVVAMPLAPSGMMLPASSKTIATPADAPTGPAIAGLGAGFVVGWEAAATGQCVVVRLNADLDIVAGPIQIAGASGACRSPRAAALGNDRIVISTNTSTMTSISVAVYDLALNAVSPIATSSGSWADVHADEDRVWVTWTEVTPPISFARYGWIDATGMLSIKPSLGSISSMTPWANVVARVNNGLVAIWQEADLTIAATRLCR